MNTVRRQTDPHNPWWRYLVTVPAAHQPRMWFANAQAAADWCAEWTALTGEAFEWDTREEATK